MKTAVMGRLLLALAILGLVGAACGGQPSQDVNKDEIRRNADQADRALDRESERNQEDK